MVNPIKCNPFLIRHLVDVYNTELCHLDVAAKQYYWQPISKGFALTWYGALTLYSSPAGPFAAPDDALLVTRQQGSPSPACRQLSRAQTAWAENSSKESTKLGNGTKSGRTFC